MEHDFEYFCFHHHLPLRNGVNKLTGLNFLVHIAMLVSGLV